MCQNRLHLFTIRIYFKGMLIHKFILFSFPQLWMTTAFSWKDWIKYPTVRHPLKKGNSFSLSGNLRNTTTFCSSLTLHVRKLRWCNLPSRSCKPPALHSWGKVFHLSQDHFWLTRLRFSSIIGCLEPVASMWRAHVRPCVEPWCPRKASRERRLTSPSLSSTPRWWACFWSLTMRCAQHNIVYKFHLCSDLQVCSDVITENLSILFYSQCGFYGTLMRQM